MEHAGLGVGHVGGDRGQLQARHKAGCGLTPALYPQGNHAAGAAGQVFFRQSVVPVAGQAGILDPCDLGVLVQIAGHRHGVFAVLGHAQGKGLQTDVQQEAVLGGGDGAQVPHELDGGRRQRIGIGRALALNPKFIVCDEPVSALDVSIQAQILNLMMDLQEKYRLTYIFVTHDLSVVKHISDDIMVMYLGVMVEKTSSEELFSCQLHPYTKALLSAIPIAKPNLDRKRIALKGELTSPIEPPKMCRFAPRCPYATERCFQEEPALEEVLPQHFVSCHRVKEINQL